MKLIYCLKCRDVVALYVPTKKRYCQCRKSWGFYKDNRKAKVGGFAVPLGIVDLPSAVANRQDKKSTRVNAFVIEKRCPFVEDEYFWDLDKYYVDQLVGVMTSLEDKDESN